MLKPDVNLFDYIGFVWYYHNRNRENSILFEQEPTVSRTERQSISFSFFLHLLLPGLGHVFWREYLFGVFVFLVTLLAVVLFFVSFFVKLPLAVQILLYGFPAMFYIFTFFDLARIIKTRRGRVIPGRRTALILLAVAIGYQLLSPIALTNFCLRNYPEVFVQGDNRLSPLFSEGDLLKASHLSYKVDLFLMDRPVLHALPSRYDPVRFVDSDGRSINGLVLGLPGEEIEAADGVIVVNGLPDIAEPPGGIILTGDCSLTHVDTYSILVARLNLGRIDRVYEVSLADLTGKIGRLF